MSVVINMILTVAEVAVTTGTVPKFQIGMGDIRLAAYSATVGIRRTGRCDCCLVRAGRLEGDRTGFLGCFFAEQPPGIDTPRGRENINHFLAEEQEIVQKRYEGEQAIGEQTDIGHHDYGVGCQTQIEQCEDPCLYRNDEEQKEVRVGIQSGIGEKQAQIQIGCSSLTAKNHAENILQKDTGKIEQIEFQRAPNVLHGSA